MDAGSKKRKKGQIAFITLALLGCAVIIGAFFWVSGAQGVWGFLPAVLVLACPLMHLFLHRHHAGHAGDERASGGRPSWLSEVRSVNDR